MKLDSAVVLGLNGGFGRLLSRHLAASGVAVRGVDVAPAADPRAACDEYLSCDLARLPEAEAQRIASTPCLLAALPEAVAFTALEALAPRLPEGALIVDLLSVKGPVARLAERLPPGLEHLSLNPMFAPDLGFAGRGVAAVELRPGPQGRAFVELLESWGARVVRQTAEGLDRQTAATQVATHAAILAFGLCLRQLGYRPEEALSLAPPPHRTLMALLGRILARDPEVYRHIQLDHPLGDAAREALAVALAELGATVADPGDDFRHRLEEVRQLLGSHLDELDDHAARLFAEPEGDKRR